MPNPLLNLTIQNVPLDSLVPFAHNPRAHPQEQVDLLAHAISKYDFTNPVLVASNMEIIAGHGRVLAARQLGLKTIPIIVLGHLNETERRAYRIADNALALKSKWTKEKLVSEVRFILDTDFVFDAADVGMLSEEIDGLVGFDINDDDDDEELPLDPDSKPVTQPGDIWTIGEHKVICGDSRDPGVFSALLGDQLVDAVISDQPWNLPVDGFISGLGKIKHAEFAMASGEMSLDDFTEFTSIVLTNQAAVCKSGAIVMQFIDWRSVDLMIGVGKSVFERLLNMAVWVKPSGSMGSPWRSRHELVCIFVAGDGKYKDRIALGKHGRYRTNVWEYASPSGFGSQRELLKLHPTCKNPAMIADAIMDCTDRGDIVLDAFLGSGTLLLAAERTGRRGRGIEYDPRYVDCAVERMAKQFELPATLPDGRDYYSIKQALERGEG